MNDTREYKFYSVEILEPKNTEYKYVCIPSSWMSFRDFSTQTAAIKHPGDVVDLDKWVANGSPFHAEWPIYKAHVKYGTDVYEDAQDYVKFLEYTEREKSKVLPLVLVAKDAESSNSLKNKIVLSTNQPVTSLVKVNAPRPNKKPQLTDPDVESKKPKIELKPAISGPAKVISFTVQNTTIELKNQASEANDSSNTCNPLIKFSKDEDINLQQTSIPQTIYKERNGKTNQTILDMKNPNLSEMLKMLLNEVEITQQVIIKLGEGYAKACSNLKKCLDILVEYKDLSKNMQDDINDEELRVKEHKKVKHREREAEQTAKTNEEDSEGFSEIDYDNMEDVNFEELDSIMYGEELAKDKQLEKEKQNKIDNETTNEQGGECKELNREENECQLESDDDEYWDKQEEIRRKRYPKGRGFPNDFTLPPEYDENDSRWTLKYRKKDNNLVELIPHSNVYIHRMGLDKCNMASDAKDLARKLLSEIFTKSALRTCSVTGKKANAFKYKKLRPGLDKHAVTVLINFVDQYAYKKSWETLDTHTIMSTLRNKLQDIRAKYRKYHKES